MEQWQTMLDEYSKMKPEKKAIVRGPLLNAVEQFNSMPLQQLEKPVGVEDDAMACRTAVTLRNRFLYARSIDDFQHAEDTMKNASQLERDYAAPSIAASARTLYNSGTPQTEITVQVGENVHGVKTILSPSMVVTTQDQLVVLDAQLSKNLMEQVGSHQLRSQHTYSTNDDFNKHMKVVSGEDGWMLQVPRSLNGKYDENSSDRKDF